MNPIPPEPHLVSTRKAAQIYGKAENTVLKALQGEGIAPRVTEKHTGGKYYWWNPVDVLRVRAVKAERLAESRRRFALMAKSGNRYKDPVAARLKARQTMLENQRRKILARIAERSCG